MEDIMNPEEFFAQDEAEEPVPPSISRAISYLTGEVLELPLHMAPTIVGTVGPEAIAIIANNLEQNRS